MPEFRKARVHNSYKAADAITKNRFVASGSTEGEVTATTTDADQNIVGIARYDASQDENVEVVDDGYTDLEVLGNSPNIAEGDFIKVADTAGRGEKTANAGETFHAIAREPATADNVVISVKLERGQVHS